MVSIKELEKRSRKEYFSFSQKTKHYLALYITRPLLNTQITPNMITIFWIFLEIIASLLMLGGYYHKLIGIIIFNFIVGILDSVDGNLARIKNIKTSQGVFLEVTGLFLGTPLLFFFLTLSIFIETDSVFLLFIGFSGVLSVVYEKLFTLNPKWYGMKNVEEFKKLYLGSPIRVKGSVYTIVGSIFRRGQPFNLLFFGILFNLVELILILYSVVFFIAFIYSLRKNYILAGKLDEKN